jgi:flagellar hook-length control protein FliK
VGFDVAPAHVLADPPPAAAALPVQTPVGASGWTEEVGTHVIWMAHQGVSSASLRLQPEHLGPLEVKISLHDSTASVWFGANEPETRTALQAALPQLKEMFAAQGMMLTDAGVSRESPRDAQLPRAATQSPSAPAAAVLESSAALPGVRRGLVDTYA